MKIKKFNKINNKPLSYKEATFILNKFNKDLCCSFYKEKNGLISLRLYITEEIFNNKIK